MAFYSVIRTLLTPINMTHSFERGEKFLSIVLCLSFLFRSFYVSLSSYRSLLLFFSLYTNLSFSVSFSPSFSVYISPSLSLFLSLYILFIYICMDEWMGKYEYRDRWIFLWRSYTQQPSSLTTYERSSDIDFDMLMKEVSSWLACGSRRITFQWWTLPVFIAWLGIVGVRKITLYTVQANEINRWFCV